MMRSASRSRMAALGVLAGMLTVGGCGWNHPSPPPATGQMHLANSYRIGPGDSVEIFVWRYPEVSATTTVRPDGYITARLLEDVPAVGKTPTELARDLEKELSVYLRDPLVSVIVGGYHGIFPEQIRVVGQAASPKAIPYVNGMTLLDLMIQVGGITEFADGNATVLVRTEDGLQKEYTLRIDDLIKDGDITANTDMRPGDILIIPESWF